MGGSLARSVSAFALDDVHRRELRERDEAAQGKRAERILDAVDRLLPKRFAEPDAELFDHQPAPARREKMAQLMDDDEQIKKDDNLEKDKNDAKDVQQHLKEGDW